MEIIKNLIVRGYIDKRASLVLEDESFSKIVIITYGSMKRDLVSNEGNGKRLRAEAARPTFLELPNDILQIILSKITAADIVNLGTVSKSFRQELKPFVFDKLQTSWYDLINEEKPLPSAWSSPDR